MSWLDREFYGGTVPEWGIALGIGLGLTLLFWYARRWIVGRLRRRAARSATRFDAALADIMAKTHLLFLLIAALYLGLQYVDLPARYGRLADRIVVVALLVQIALWGNRAIKRWLAAPLPGRREAEAAGATTVSVLGVIAQIVLWSLVLLLVLDNIGVNITALVAGFGIGGIAVALAMQNILGDVFASLSIALDKPFEIGDFIITGAELGTVEYIGIKTTRLRSLSGEQIVLSNADLLKSRIRNYKRMAERRVVLGFGVVYETPAEVLERIPAMVRSIVERQANTRFDRAHFMRYGESSLDFEVVYYFGTPDYNAYMDVQQAINLDLLRSFQKERITFAYPTRTLYLNNATAADTVAPVR